MLYWSGFTEPQWNSFDESGWYYFDLDRSPIFYGSIFSSIKYEDLSSYLPGSSLYPNSSYDYIDTASGYALVTGELQNTTAKIGRLYKDAGVGYYSGIFTHDFSFVTHLPVGTYGFVDLWALSNTIDTENNWSSNSDQAVRLSLNNGKLSLRCHENTNYNNSTYSLASGVPYHVRVNRVDTALAAYTYDNPSYSGTYLDSLSIVLPASRNYRYFWVLNKPTYSAAHTGRVSYTAFNYNLENSDWQATMTPIYGLSAETSGVATFNGLLNLIEAMEGSLSGSSTFAADMHIGFQSGLELYVRGIQTTTEYIPLYISGEYPTVFGSLPLYIGASGQTAYLYLYTEGYGTHPGYYQISESIPLFIGNPASTYSAGALPLYLDCALGTIASGLYLHTHGDLPVSSGLDLFVSGVGLVSTNNILKLYTHGY